MKWPAFLKFGRKSDSTLELFNEIFGARLSAAGVNVTWDTALKVATVLACTRAIALGLAQVPLKIFQETDGKKLPAHDHPLYFVLHNQPNPWQTSFEYLETIGYHLPLTGRHYSFINRGVGGRILELIPFEPGQVEAKRAADGEITYRVTLANGKQVEYPEEAIWHIRGASWNGWQGMDPVHLAREAIGLTIAAEEEHSRMFANGVRPSGIYSVEGNLSPEQYKNLRRALVDSHTGANKGLPMILDRGAKWLQQAMTGVDAQHVETRRLQIEEVCRAMGVFPQMIGHTDKTATFASAEAFFIAHVVYTLTPWYRRLEQSIDAHLIGRKDVERGYYAKFISAGLLRGAMKDRGEYLSRALGAGGAPAWMTQDEVRSLEELNPMGGEAAALPKPTNVPGGGKAASGNTGEGPTK